MIGRVDRWGEGNLPALLLHGFTHAGSSWRTLERSWGAKLSVLAPDLPGHGSSEWPPLSEPPGGFEAVVDGLAAAMDREWNRPAAVVGYSQGARLGLALALRHPGKVSHLVVESGAPGLESREEREARCAEDVVRAERIERLGVPAFIREWEARPLFSGVRALSEAKQQNLRNARLGHRAEGLSRALRVMGQGSQPSYGKALRGLLPPALFIAGSRDEKYRALAREMAARAPRAQLLLFNCGHAPHLEAPGYAQAVLDFLSGVVLGGTA